CLRRDPAVPRVPAADREESADRPGARGGPYGADRRRRRRAGGRARGAGDRGGGRLGRTAARDRRVHRDVGPRVATAGEAAVRRRAVAGPGGRSAWDLAAAGADARGPGPDRAAQGAAPRRAMGKTSTSAGACPYGIAMTDPSRLLAGRRGLSRPE